MGDCDWAILSERIDRNQPSTSASYMFKRHDDWAMASPCIINRLSFNTHECDMALAFAMASHDRLGDNATSKDIFVELGIIEMIFHMFYDTCQEERRELYLQFRLEYMKVNRSDVSHRVRRVHWNRMTSDTTDLRIYGRHAQPSLELERPRISTLSIDAAFLALNRQYFVTCSPLHQVRTFVKHPWCLYWWSGFHSFLKKRKKKLKAV